MATETGEITQVRGRDIPQEEVLLRARVGGRRCPARCRFMILFLVFRVWPIIQAIRLSFDNVESIGQSEFIGLGNYQELLADERFLDACRQQRPLHPRHSPVADTDPSGSGGASFSGRVKAPGAFRTILFVPLLAGLVVVAVDIPAAPECRRHPQSDPGSNWDCPGRNGWRLRVSPSRR